MDSAGLDTAVMHTVRSRLGQRMGARCGLESGGGGIRTLERPVTSNGFRDRRIRPLCHPSGSELKAASFEAEKEGFEPSREEITPLTP